ncbi:hypothetical protein [Flavobacterium faecale]|uniref:hypothetical protein n=1 Tax=Flavobacterium faecale TaxID=1355330 RepID=UPI003AAEA71E
MADKIIHPSDSAKQREIELFIVNEIAKKENLIFEEKKTIIEEVAFEFDFYHKEKKIIGEIYAGIEKISAGSRKKVITDCFKLVYAEKLLGYPCKKRLVFIDENIKKVFTGKSWVANAIKEFGIIIDVIPISQEIMNELIEIKKIQQCSNKKIQS